MFDDLVAAAAEWLGIPGDAPDAVWAEGVGFAGQGEGLGVNGGGSSCIEGWDD